MKRTEGERRRRPWFSIFLTIVALASVITLFNSGALNAGHGSFGLYLTHLADRVFTGPAEARTSAPATVTLADIGRPDGLFISGYPSYASLKLPVVRDADLGEVRLVVRGVQDVSASAVAALRLTVNGQRVLERVLAPGTRDFEWTVALPRAALTSGDLDVGFQLHGDLPDELCHNDRSIGAVVTIDPSTAVEMDLRGPIRSLRDVVSLLPSDITIALPQSGDDYFPMALHLGARMIQRGYTVDYVDMADVPRLRGRGLILLGDADTLTRAGFQPVSDTNLRESATLWERRGYVQLGLTDARNASAIDFLTSELLPIARTAFVEANAFQEASHRSAMTLFGDMGVDTSVQNVAEQRNWDVKYGLSALPDGRAPDRLRLELRLPEGPGDFTNLVHTELNGVLIDSRHVETGRLNTFTLALPSAAQALRNDIRVSVQRHREAGGCTITARRYPIQLLPESALLYDDVVRPLDGLAGLPLAFNDRVELLVPRDLDGEERLSVLQMGAEIVASFVPAQAQIDLTYVEPSDPRSTQVHRAFIALNHTPANAQAAFDVHDDAIAVQGSQRFQSADIGNLESVAVLQTASALVNRPTRNALDRVVPVPGLIAHAMDRPPSLMTAQIGQEQAAIVHGLGAVLVLD